MTILTKDLDKLKNYNPFKKKKRNQTKNPIHLFSSSSILGHWLTTQSYCAII